MQKGIFVCFLLLIVGCFSNILKVEAKEKMLIPPQDTDNTLVELVNKCVRAEKNNSEWPLFCAKVSTKKETNFTIINPKEGLAKVMLLANQDINGIEDPILFKKRTPSFLNFAWENRQLISKKLQKSTGRKRKIPEQNFFFSINAIQSRTQNRLHIHMSCVKKEYRLKLSNKGNLERYSFRWENVPFNVVNPHTGKNINYIVKLFSKKDLEEGKIHRAIYEKVGWRYPNYGIGMWSVSRDKFLILITDDANLAAPGRVFSDNNCSEFIN
ncbi:CDP-diacylglycerol diphosphatase [Enterococcus faecalis]|uniref:CDP-diacylglycerol diphosphatase n=1 Tax=Enterococcus faecalis TaxID=1351 RepID=UPI0004594F09|nr:CDP-diacylglycerol diphosphatase [Enterococcus faecalis]KAJ84721.1 CDP-diacylglycerol pyrophosphatase [Enterococcus faecalis NY9]